MIKDLNMIVTSSKDRDIKFWSPPKSWIFGEPGLSSISELYLRFGVLSIKEEIDEMDKLEKGLIDNIQESNGQQDEILDIKDF